jgi:hypothetical protein
MTVEEAIPIAIDYVKKLFQGNDYRLEEVELGDSEKTAFIITVSFRPPVMMSPNTVQLGNTSASDMFGFGNRRAAIGIDVSRAYKDVVVTSDGQVRAVRMRQIVVG